MEKWEIRATPTGDDPDRHVLLLQGGPADVAALIKKFGALLGRPSAAQERPFNLRVVLHRLDAAARGRLDAWLREAAPSAAARAVPSVAPPVAPTVPAAPTAASERVPGPEPAAVAAISPSATTGFSLAVELNKEWTFETLLVGAYNRFAHAAAMSVVTSPGTMYSPLFLYGPPSAGKSHLLNAIGGSLAKGLGGGATWSTSGSRLSRAVDAALARNDMAEIEARVNVSRALLVDDIHLLALTDQNKEALTRIFRSFFDRQLQVVITSLYPPRSLSALEEGLQFSFSRGWSVDLKVPNPTIQKELIAAAAGRSGAGLGADELTFLQEKLQGGYSDLAVWLKRVAVFKRTRAAAGQPATLQDLLPHIYDVALSGVGADSKATATQFTPPPAPADAEPMAVIVPKDHEELGKIAVARFYEAGARNGFPQIYRHVLWSTYDPNALFGVPFLIGEICGRAGVTRALIVGPTPDSPLGPRAAEFAHAARHILGSFDVEMAWIPYAGIQTGACYLNAHLDLARFPPRS